MSDLAEKSHGYQITEDVIQKAIVNDYNSAIDIEDIKILDIKKSQGANKGEGYTCVLFALDIKAIIKGNEKSFQYMAKCLPAIEHRAKFVLEVSHFFLREKIYNLYN